MPKAPREVVISSRSLETPRISYQRTGMIIEGTKDCLALVEHKGGFILYHTLSGGCIASNLDNTFKTFDEAEKFALKFWAGIKTSGLALKKYQTSDEIRMLNIVTPPATAAMATRRTNRAKVTKKSKKKSNKRK